MKDRKSRDTLKRVLGYIGHHKYIVFLSLLLSVAQVALTLIVPYLCGQAIDQILDTGVRMDLIAPLLARIVLLVALAASLQWLMNVLNNRVVYSVVHDLRSDALKKIQALPLSYIDGHPHGELVSRVIADADAFSDGLLMGFTQMFTGVLTIAGTLAILFRFQPVIAAASGNVNGASNEPRVVLASSEPGDVDMFDLYVEYIRSQLKQDEFFDEFSAALDTVFEAGYDESTMPFAMFIENGALGYEDFAAYYQANGENPPPAAFDVFFGG